MNKKRYLKLSDLITTFENDAVFIRSNTSGVGIKTEPMIMTVLAFFTTPKSEKDFEVEYGSDALSVMNELIDSGLLVEENHQNDTPTFFGFFSGLDVHRRMLADQERLSKYREAIFRSVKKGDVVVDAGAGTGILSIYAAQAGAGKVYAIDNSEMASFMPRLIAENGYEDIIEVIQADFGEVVLPEKADLIVTETFGFWVIDEGALPDLKSCAENNLKERGAIIPSEFSLYLAPVKKKLNNLTSVFRHRDDKVKMESLAQEAEIQSSVNKLDAADIGAEVKVGTYSILNDKNLIIKSEVTLEGPCEAISAFFTLHLAEGVDLSNAPAQPTTSWKQATLPVQLKSVKSQLHLTIRHAPENKRAISLDISGAVRKNLRIS